MSASFEHAHLPNAILKPDEMPTSLGGDSAKYQSTGGNGYGFDGKEIRAGVMEFSSYKSGGSRKKRRQSRRQQRNQRSLKKRRVGGSKRRQNKRR
jgi:hypothetical protein